MGLVIEEGEQMKIYIGDHFIQQWGVTLYSKHADVCWLSLNYGPRRPHMHTLRDESVFSSRGINV